MLYPKISFHSANSLILQKDTAIPNHQDDYNQIQAWTELTSRHNTSSCHISVEAIHNAQAHHTRTGIQE
jgi:hypothetical protein